MPSPEDGIRQSLADYTAACNAGDVTAYTATMTPDVVYVPPDQPSIRGREAVGQWAKEGFFDPFSVTFAATIDRIVVAGTEAFVPGTFTLHLRPRAGGAPVDASGAFFDIFRRDAGGKWQLAHAIFNFDQPFAAAH